MRKLLADFISRPWQRRYAVPLLFVNLAGSAYGYWWYHRQLAETPLLAWPLVPDSPFSTTLFAAALAACLAGARFTALAVVACAANVKYGLWAVAVIGHYWWLGGDIAPVEVMLWLSHLGMAAQGVLFWRPLSYSLPAVWAAAGWMLANDLADYLWGLHPYLFAPGQERVAAAAAWALSLAVVFVFFLRRHRGRGALKSRGRSPGGDGAAAG